MGTAFTTMGAVVIGWNDIISKEKAVEIGVMRISGDTMEQNLTLPAVKELLRRGRNSKIGLFFVLIGYVCLILAIATQGEAV